MNIHCQMVSAVLEYGGQKVRTTDLLESQTPITITKKFLRGLKVSSNWTILFNHQVVNVRSAIIHYLLSLIRIIMC